MLLSTKPFSCTILNDAYFHTTLYFEEMMNELCWIDHLRYNAGVMKVCIINTFSMKFSSLILQSFTYYISLWTPHRDPLLTTAICIVLRSIYRTLPVGLACIIHYALLFAVIINVYSVACHYCHNCVVLFNNTYVITWPWTVRMKVTLFVSGPCRSIPDMSITMLANCYPVCGRAKHISFI